MNPHLRRTRRTLGAALAASTLVAGAAACAGEGDDGTAADVQTEAVEPGRFEATAAYLRSAAEQSTAEGYHLEMRLSMTGEVDDTTPPMMTGEVDGDRYHFVMDMGPMMSQMTEGFGEAMPPEMADLDLTMEMAGDPEALYMRAPMFAALGDLTGGEALGPAGGLADLGDSWGYVDMQALGDQVPADVAAALGGQTFDPAAIVSMIEGAEGVEELGDDEIDGTPVHGLTAEVSMGDVLEAVGQDPETVAETASMGADEAVASLYDMATDIEVWVDDDGYLRRMVYGYSLDQIAEAMGEDAGLPGMSGMRFSYAMDMSDYGATVEFEPPADAVDITDDYAALIES
jgi:hypothetical protein